VDFRESISLVSIEAALKPGTAWIDASQPSTHRRLLALLRNPKCHLNGIALGLRGETCAGVRVKPKMLPRCPAFTF
jgi:hypothetical protein